MDFGLAKAGHRQEIMTRCSFSKCHCLVFVCMFAVVGYLYIINVKDMMPELNPKLWMQRHSTKLFFVFRGSDAAVSNTTDVLPNSTTTQNTQKPDPLQLTTVTPTIPNQSPTPVPYVSPGPYIVEYPYKYHFLINEPEKCEQDKPFLVLIVQVAPHNREARDVIRSTWGSQHLAHGKQVSLFFLLGSSNEKAEPPNDELLLESKEHRDLIQSNFVDCYKNLTIKTMVMMEWLSSYCSKASYAMKIDSDMFLNVPNLVHMLLEVPKTNYMTGLVAYDGPVLRDPSSKWYLPRDIFPENTYPPYPLGLGYVVSLDLSVKFIQASRHVTALYIEDVYLGLCLKYLGIPPTNPKGAFHVFPVTYNRCAYSKLVATTLPSGLDPRWLWNDFKNPGPYC